jgi:hypothetical protein
MKAVYDAGDQGLQPCDAHSVTRDKDRRVMVSIRVQTMTMNVLGQFVRDLNGNKIDWGSTVPNVGDKMELE